MLSIKQTRPGKKVPCYDGSKSVLAKRWHAFVKANAFLYPGSHATVVANPFLQKVNHATAIANLFLQKKCHAIRKANLFPFENIPVTTGAY